MTKDFLKDYNRSYIHAQGIVVPVTNVTLDDPNGIFFISYNKYEEDYGCDTTALVYGNHEAFFILDGDHRQAYVNIIANQGWNWEACFEYFNANESCRNFRSDVGTPEEVRAKFQAMLDKLERRLEK